MTPHSAAGCDQIITLIEPADPDPLVVEISRQLSLQLDTMGLRTKTVQWSTDVSDLRGKTLVFLLELQSTFLQNISTEDYTALKALVLNSARLLWVATGNDPAMQAAIGYLRVLQNENINLDLRFLLLEECVGRSADHIAQILAPVVIAPTTDREYMELNGCLHINRWVNEDNLSRIMATNDSQNDSELIPLSTATTPLKLLYSHSEGMKLQTLYGAVDQVWTESLAAGEVEVQVRAIGLK